ncbi:HAMP domain-containing histidine kinase [Taibaiella lutea]|uniref:histidine kinase n=2 Tax=Taibaiella lutea TaxID=2608001 RepID=A0A5M6CC68_9BACT|nr:HAMP domain-containing histidine kinase [Taibaiella lutea]
MVAHANFPQSAASSYLIKNLRNEYLEKLPFEKEYFQEIRDENSYSIPALNLPGEFYENLKIYNNASYKSKDTYYAGILHKQGRKKIVVIVAAQNEYIKNQLINLKLILLLGFLLTIGLTFFLGFLFSKQIFLPIRKMTQRVKEINTENLHLRLSENTNKDEVGDLAHTFNNMLDRLETSFESQNNFVSNASHELSTPLTSIIGEAELALSKERNPEEYRQAMLIVLQDAERLKAIIQSLLNLAQTGFDGKKQQMVLLRTDELVVNAKSAVDRIYPDNKIHIDYSLMPEDEQLLKIKGNESLLTLALTNIMLNACKYSNNDEVKVGIGATNQHVVLLIQDKGIGIPASDIQYIYDPFFRASNTGKIKGYGIGLPLARNIVRIHKGELKVSSVVNEGTLVELYLPAASRF